MKNDTIVAQATPPGRGGVAIVRVSGPLVKNIATRLLDKLPQPRYAEYCIFHDENHSALDMGIALFFQGPNSFTGEDILELQGHGGPVVVDNLIKHILKLGARLARPGEFSERAFLNDKIDLTQAEAIADLIDSASEEAARSALRSLQGEFSKQINQLLEELVKLRIYVEAAIDFPEEEIDFLSDGQVEGGLQKIITTLDTTLFKVTQGVLLNEGMTIVIAGRPNAGKSSLLNALSGTDTAIVTDIPGTTRDVLRTRIQIDGMPLHIIDTAGLHDSADRVEQEGMRRARQEIERADRVLWIIDDTVKDRDTAYLPPQRLSYIHNKIDITGHAPGLEQIDQQPHLFISAKTGAGLDSLRDHLKVCMGFVTQTEGNFIARRRHLEALHKTRDYLLNGQQQLVAHRAGELLAEDLRQAQQALGEITGQFSSDDLLGRIFSSFCIGK